jgi:hypothetical protein
MYTVVFFKKYVTTKSTLIWGTKCGAKQSGHKKWGDFYI